MIRRWKGERYARARPEESACADVGERIVGGPAHSTARSEQQSAPTSALARYGARVRHVRISTTSLSLDALLYF